MEEVIGGWIHKGVPSAENGRRLEDVDRALGEIDVAQW